MITTPYVLHIIHIEYDSSPSLFDYDSDGDLDLLVGSLDGKIKSIENTGFDEGLQCGAELSFSREECTAGGSGSEEASKQVDNIIQTAINIISIVVAVIAVIMIIIGGFKYITSNGDSGAVSGAKNTILYAVVGLVVVALAQVIVRFVVGKLTEEPTD